jgi:hypothetical protein
MDLLVVQRASQGRLTALLDKPAVAPDINVVTSGRSVLSVINRPFYSGA